MLLLAFAFWTMIFACCWGLSVGCFGLMESLGLSATFAGLFFGVRREAPVVATVPPEHAQAAQALYAA